MALNFKRLGQNRFILATSSLAAAGWLVTFCGAVAIRTLYGAWWVVTYETLIVFGALLLFMSDSMQHYRLGFLTFLGASIPLLTIQVDYVVQYTKLSAPREPANAYAAGYVILICVQYMWIIVFGSDPDSSLGQWGYIEALPSRLSTAKYTSTISYTDKHIDVSGFMNCLTPEPPLHDLTMLETVGTEYREKVEALHSYKANSADPNELSFEKGEVLEIVDRKGSWWQARKATGETGIIPSNYFGQHSINTNSNTMESHQY
ncbi:hypothetical protein BX666DRAFT_1982290 [Dichotomocladium elegans]|nr:hypothetical protein BX666DRAFT_1982290 [Dichotomocladium elegans]